MQGSRFPVSLCPRCRGPLPQDAFTIIRCASCGLEMNVGPELPSNAAPIQQGRVKKSTFIWLGIGMFVSFVISVLFGTGIVKRPSRITKESLTQQSTGPDNADDFGSWVSGASSTLGPLLVKTGTENKLIGLVNRKKGNASLVAFDLQSGQVRWSNPSISASHSTGFSDGKLSLILGRDADFTARSIDLSTGKLRWERKLSDRLTNVSFGFECLITAAADGKQQAFHFSSGELLPTCPSAKPVTTQQVASFSNSATYGDTTLSISVTSPGTPRIVINALRAKKQIWEQTLPITTEHPIPWFAEKSIARTAHGFVVLGQMPGTTASAVMLLDANTGKVTASAEQPGNTSQSGAFLRIAANDDVAAIESFGNIQALALPSLQPLWKSKSFF